MPYTHCSACGAKALVGATRCPRCQVPFVSYDPGADRVVTVNCPNCGVQRPVAIGVCPNCLMSTAPSGRRLTRGLVLVGLAIGVLMAVGYAISRYTERTPSPAAPPVADRVAAVETPPTTDSLRAPAADSAVTSTALSVAPTTVASAPISPPATPVAAVTLKPAPPPSVAVSDTGRWEYAVAVTWVRVRSAPTRDSEVLRMVDSAQRVRLGPPQNGWRPVRVGVDRGWVDPRLFTVVAAPRP
jgi:hypothetical protein